ncbi:hypothetical protein SAMN05444006_10580 [Allgaiera indica]|uniref:Uncharacterized protein n=1 Tax=Allgaiera indica TaxID=765699 RepID=A0A1H2UXY0_9RHOB|nr:hypothetical protein SAMN05444006_10580 [Allgaiera indica]
MIRETLANEAGLRPAARASAETVLTIADDPMRLGAKVCRTAALHAWGSASCCKHALGATTHHPHVRMFVPGAGYHSMAPAGSPAAPASSCMSGFSPACSAASFCRGWPRSIVPTSSPSSMISPGSPSPRPSPPGLPLPASPNGWSMDSVEKFDPDFQPARHAARSSRCLTPLTVSAWRVRGGFGRLRRCGTRPWRRSEAKTVETEYALEVGEEHLDLLAGATGRDIRIVRGDLPRLLARALLS